MSEHQHDYVVVGSGLTGAIIARELWDAGRDVLVLDRRKHIGGNVHDHIHHSGIRIHTYGPHYFRTNSDELWDYVNRFTSFQPYVACIQTLVGGRYEQWPISSSYLHQHVGVGWKPEFTGQPRNFEEASLGMMPRIVYENFIKGYSEKQWGCPAHLLWADLAKRFDVREDDDPRLFRYRHQGIPTNGYASFTKNILDGIPVRLECDYLRERDRFRHKKLLIFTGPIDEYFEYKLGRLQYRGQRRTHTYYRDKRLLQPCGQVNNPDPKNGPHIRSLEWKHMMPEHERNHIRGTVITREITFTPLIPDQFEYPFPDQANAARYAQYRQLANSLNDVLICGRLGEYRYFDMDQAIARALTLSRRIIETLVIQRSA